MFGWIGNLFIVAGLWQVGNKIRAAFIYTMIGEAFYFVHVAIRHDWAILAAVTIFFSLAARNWYKWGQDENHSADVDELLNDPGDYH